MTNTNNMVPCLADQFVFEETNPSSHQLRNITSPNPFITWCIALLSKPRCVSKVKCQSFVDNLTRW